MSWTALPEAVQHLILAKLPASSLWALRCVGAERRRAASADDLWQRLGFASFELALELKELKNEAAEHEAAEHEAADVSTSTDYSSRSRQVESFLFLLLAPRVSETRGVVWLC
jgi:hypothetical protein